VRVHLASAATNRQGKLASGAKRCYQINTTAYGESPMKRFVFLAMILLLAAVSCSYIQKEAVPEGLYTAPSMTTQNLHKSQHVVLTDYGFRLFTIPISIPDPNAMVADAVRANGGRGVTNLDVEFSEFNILLFQIPKMRIECDIVKAE